MYTYSEVARLAGVYPTTVRRWIHGYGGQSGQMRPVFGSPKKRSDTHIAAVSFLQLAEIVIVSQFRRKHITLERLRRAHLFAHVHFNLEYPFARLSLATDGVRVLHQFEESEPGDSLLVLESGQLTLPGYVAEAIQTFDFVDDLAARWFPMGKDVPIVVDPRYGAGRPTITERRLTIETIHKRWLAGQKIQFIAEDCDLEPALVEDALRYAKKYAA
jgi:uncharacterized protein (DUF433 family)